ncbi:GIY-YIG nuclease family protein [Eubacterium multiforme]|uniref:Endonuclease n=1 Tax=Eubacterium multiforme TaxID=83339 RepID=A0ABT9UUH9_9FIRM|nr:GIY-YIG nuclease family protein [Eubacterium multiforme]MDQ0149936.1 putative endonuclease [Eubacterium multiforme]
MNYVYIIKCKDNSLYTGWTNNLEERFKAHSEGRGAKYTRGRGPLELVYFEEYENKIDAMKREFKIKKLNRKDKLILINNFNKSGKK